jgi:DNA-binding NarL/FixJ family response regulator
LSDFGVGFRFMLGLQMPPRILIVDDSSIIRNLLRNCFESEPGWKVSGEAANGKEGIEKAKDTHPNLIVLDLSMPVMNGIEAAKILTKLMPSVPLLMFTSFLTSTLEREALAAGIRKVLVKSGPLADLVGCVRSLVRDAA